MKKRNYACPHEHVCTVTIASAAYRSNIATCRECAPERVHHAIVEVVQPGVAFVMLLEMNEVKLALSGVWEGVPRYLSSKEIGALISLWTDEAEEET